MTCKKCQNRTLLFSIFHLFFFVFASSAQDINQIIPNKKLESGRVEWVGQFPSSENKHTKKDFKQQIKNIIFGKKTIGLKRPVSLIAAGQSSFWILDQENNAVFNVENGVAKIPRFIEKKNFKFSSLVSVCSFHKDEILFTDSYLNKIFISNSEKKTCHILNDTLKLDKPTGIAYSQVSKEIWVLETGAHRIVVLNEKGEVVKKIGSRGIEKGQFNFPTHISIDNKGNVYVVDAMNFRIQVFNKEGEVLSVFGKNGDASGCFASPKGIATDSYGNIYIVDALFHAVQIFDISGRFLYSFGNQGQGEGEFWMPSGIYIDENDKIFVADSYNSRIQIFKLIAGGNK